MMQSKRKPPLETVKVNSGLIPDAGSYPYFHLHPLQTETGSRYCLYLHLSPQKYLLLIASDSRYRIMQRLERWQRTAPLTVLETHKE